VNAVANFVLLLVLEALTYKAEGNQQPSQAPTNRGLEGSETIPYGSTQFFSKNWGSASHRIR